MDESGYDPFKDSEPGAEAAAPDSNAEPTVAEPTVAEPHLPAVVKPPSQSAESY